MPSNEAFPNTNPLLPNDVSANFAEVPYLDSNRNTQHPLLPSSRASWEALPKLEAEPFLGTTVLLESGIHPNVLEPQPQKESDRLTGSTHDRAWVGLWSDDLTGGSVHPIADSDTQPATTDAQFSQATPLSVEILEIFRQETIARWAQTGVDEAKLSQLQAVTFQIADLAGDRLELKTGNTITFDVDAAGQGWFIDATPWNDEEFPTIISPSELRTTTNISAFGKVDLLTVMAHEMGHILGLDHPDSVDGADNVMAEALAVGVRRSPTLEDLNFAHEESNDALEEALTLAGSQTRITAESPGNQQTSEFTPQSVGTAPNGSYIITWSSQGQNGSGWGIFAQRFNADGTPLGDEFQVNTTTNNNQQHSAVAVDATGNFVITWTGNGQDGSYTGIYAQRFDAAGQKLGGEFQVNTYTSSDQSYPAIATDVEGNFVITWSSYYQDGPSWGVYAQRFDKQGNRVGDDLGNPI